jgi:seryl-tRNA synthetase
LCRYTAGAAEKEGVASAAASAATGRVRELEEELTGVLQESESLIKEKEALVKEVNIRAQELVEERADNEARRRSTNAEKEEMERQLYALTKDREEALATFRTER